MRRSGDMAEKDAVEVRALWAVRWPDGTLMGPMYSDDGSDYAEQVIRRAARDVGAEVVTRTETITRTAWAVASPWAEPSTPPGEAG